MQLLIFVFALLPSIVSSCRQIRAESQYFGALDFSPIVTNYSSTRLAYATSDSPPLYLYHISEDISGSGRWVMDHVLGSNDSAVAFIDTWAVTPTLIHAVNRETKRSWTIYDSNTWVIDESLNCFCISDEGETTFFFDATEVHNVHDASGFFVETVYPNYPGRVYEQVQSNKKKQYLFKIENFWIVGDRPGERNGIAYLQDPADVPSAITSVNWYFLTSDNTWQEGYAILLHNDKEANAYANLRRHRLLRDTNPNSKFFLLSNGMTMPTIGLGTGGIPLETTSEVLSDAFAAGFRMVDLAREYNNEGILAEVIAAGLSSPLVPLRNEVFVISKVWPTHLGFKPTSDEITNSLFSLNSSYVDLYLLHWPECLSDIEWMHCETSVDPQGTWQQSWRALERAYAEGRLMNIGVSNFNAVTLQYMDQFANILPHVVQNYATVGQMEMDVRYWCSDNGAVFIPYGTMRNINDLENEPLYNTLIDIAAKYNSTIESVVKPELVVSKFMSQTRAAIIPRTTNVEHMRQLMQMHEWSLTDAEMVSLGWIVESTRAEL